VREAVRISLQDGNKNTHILPFIFFNYFFFQTEWMVGCFGGLTKLDQFLPFEEEEEKCFRVNG